jgi:hypothetical protein
MIRLVGVVCAVLVLSGTAVAQESTPPAAPAPEASTSMDARSAMNTIYLELLGSGLIYSINYERFVHDDVALRVGFSYFSISASAGSGGTTASASASLITFPITASYLGLRSGSHALELGGGAVIAMFDVEANSSTGDSFGGDTFASGTGVAGTLIAGYRYAPVDGGFNFRAAITPIFSEEGFAFWGGLAFGYGF